MAELDIDAELKEGAQYESALYAAAMEPGAGPPVSVSKSTLADLLERHQGVRAALLRARAEIEIERKHWQSLIEGHTHHRAHDLPTVEVTIHSAAQAELRMRRARNDRALAEVLGNG